MGRINPPFTLEELDRIEIALRVAWNEYRQWAIQCGNKARTEEHGTAPMLRNEECGHKTAAEFLALADKVFTMTKKGESTWDAKR